MAFDGLLVTEIFHSIQGETSLAGERFSFIRLTGCNLRCKYCDSTYAFKGGKRLSIEQIINEISSHETQHVLLTGGEPLLQRNTPLLSKTLSQHGWHVSIETHGECDISPVVADARIIMDIKTPGSGMYRGGYQKNLSLLKPTDEIKFVICSHADLLWATEITRKELSQFKGKVLFSTSNYHPESPLPQDSFSIRILAEHVLSEKLPVRVQTQLHKHIWEPSQRGV